VRSPNFGPPRYENPDRVSWSGFVVVWVSVGRPVSQNHVQLDTGLNASKEIDTGDAGSTRRLFDA
jgi:hypothetical protein